MTNLPPFKKNDLFTVGVELELQLVNLHTYNLAMEAEDFLRRIELIKHEGEIKPEITQSMIEINSSIHTNYPSLIKELNTVRDFLINEAAKAHIGICGGGTHPFQKWQHQRISNTERFESVSEQYGYLAKQFTVFGQHIHIACPSGDDALYLCHAMIRYLPHFIALSAASPFNQAVDTAFDCSRLAIVSAFPLSGTPPWLFTWEEFEAYFNKLHDLKIVNGIKDFYWDIRPKPEFGTIEIRICDNPLTVERAADLAGYAQSLVYMLLDKRPVVTHDIYLTYLMNRFRAARYGLEAIISDIDIKESQSLALDIIQTCHELRPYAAELGNEEALNNVKIMVANKENDASWLRRKLLQYGSLSDVVRAQTHLWAMNNNA